MSKAAAMGAIRGARITMAEKMSTRQPTTIRSTLSAARKTRGEWMLSLTHASSASGIIASTM